MVVYHLELTVLRCSSGTIATGPVFPKKAKGKCFVCEHFLLDLAHLETYIQSTAVYFRAHTRKSTIDHLSRCHRRVSKHSDRILELLFRPIDTSLFLSDWQKMCGIQLEEIFFTVKCSYNIECMLVPLMPKVVSISR